MEFKAIALLNPSEVLETSLINMVELQVHVFVPPNLPPFKPSACVCGEDNVCVSQLHTLNSSPSQFVHTPSCCTMLPCSLVTAYHVFPSPLSFMLQ